MNSRNRSKSLVDICLDLFKMNVVGGYSKYKDYKRALIMNEFFYNSKET